MSDNTIRVGIGITTTATRRKTFALCMRQLNKHTVPQNGVEFVYHVQTFYPLKHSGISAVKNCCIRELMAKDCDYLFLFDDDCFPVHDDWIWPFIEAHVKTKQHHFLYLADVSDRYPLGVGQKKMESKNGVDIYRGAQGCCIFTTRHAIEKIGGFDENYKGYGWEHENFSVRHWLMQLNTYGPFLSLPNIQDYIYSLDIQGLGKYEKMLGNETFGGKMKSAAKISVMREKTKRNEQLYRELEKKINDKQIINVYFPLNPKTN